MFGLKTATSTVLVGILLSAPAFAAHCPMDAKAIENGLANIEVSDQERSTIMKLHEEGLAAHKAGDHGVAESKLAEAMRMLLNASAM
ncbi:MAG: hypothetical protein CMI01_17855 [Oceanospirillaceae bacterium]|jgi:hypothetical protein|nr:hypothetical protein [Oceanospirillaceae bacterium]